MVRYIFAILAAVLLADGALAQDRVRLGYGRLLTNDALGDNDDRWRTGSIASSRVWGPAWDGTAPGTFGSLIELRLGGQVIAPANLVTPDPRDRSYVGALSVGAHTHMHRQGYDLSFGADLVFTGDATKLDELQGGLHDIISLSQPSFAVTDTQIGNGVHPTLVMEVARDLSLGPQTALRPFVEARAGVETYLRAGFDLTFGQVGQGELMVRDPVTGHRYRVIQQNWSGFSFVIGADIAHVADSVYLPDDRSAVLSDTRERIRAGVHWQNNRGASLFYGITYLGEEFDAQPEGQLTGSIRLKFRF